VDIFLQNGADINTKNSNGWTPLHQAAGKANLDVVQELLENGACLCTTTNYGKTPLDFASDNEGGAYFKLYQRKQSYSWLIIYGKQMHQRSGSHYWLMYTWNIKVRSSTEENRINRPKAI
jgi:ankyrin repeat protein